MPTLQEKIGKAKFEGIDNAWILVSATWREKQLGGDRVVKANMSFLYDAGEIAVEWEPQYGPIQIWYKCSEDHEDPRPHYFYDFVINNRADWAQGAVYRLGLPAAFVRGNYKYIFAVLKDWAENR